MNLQFTIKKLYKTFPFSSSPSPLQRGFTLFEILVATSLMILIGLIGTGILFDVLRGSNKVEITNKVKQNGNFTLDLLERQIRNSPVIYSGIDDQGRGIPISSSTGCLNNIIVQDPGPPEVYTRFYLVPEGQENGFIAMAQDSNIANLPQASDSNISSKSITNRDLVSGVSLSPSDACFTVTYTQGAPLLVAISFTLTQGRQAPSRNDFIVSVPFSTSVSQRTY